MRWAELGLSYLQVLAWPVVVLCALVLFRGQLRGLLSNVTKFSAFGAEAKFAVRLSEQIEVTSTEIRQSEARTNEAYDLYAVEFIDEDLLHELSFVELSDLHPGKPGPNAEEAFRRLNSAIRNVHIYFQIPVDIIDPRTAALSLEVKTANSDWADFFRFLGKCEKLFNRARKARNSWLARFASEPDGEADESFVTLTGLVYVLADSLNHNVRDSLLNQESRSTESSGVLRRDLEQGNVADQLDTSSGSAIEETD